MQYLNQAGNMATYTGPVEIPTPSVIDQTSKRIGECASRIHALASTLSRHTNSLVGPMPPTAVGEAKGIPHGAGLIGDVSDLENSISELESVVARFS